MQSGVGDIGRHNIYHTTNKPYAPTVSIRQHITKKTSEIMYLNLRKASDIRTVAILPNSRPSTGWRQGFLTNNYIKEIFDVGELRYSRTATIKLWRQHLGAQPRETLPQPLNARRHQEQCSRHKNIGTIPRYPRDPKFFLWNLRREESKLLRQEASLERRRDWGVKRILLSDIYNPNTQNIFFLTQQRPNYTINQGGS